jgi:UDP-N-acetylmuramoylalanine--D-glutamate ligase
MTSLHYVIVGLGVTGLSCVRYLRASGIPFSVTDSRENPPNLAVFQADYPDVPLVLGKLDNALLDTATTIVLSPGVALQEPAIQEQVKRGVPIIGDIELFAQAIKVPVIAITGTNAKSTVTTLVGKMAEEAGYQVQVGGNLGVPALDLLAANPSANLFVLELSSFQLETTSSLHPVVATVLNITPDHMDRYHHLSEYQAAKHRVYLHSKKVVCNRDDLLTDTAAKQKVTFTLKAPNKNEFGLLINNSDVCLAFEDKKLISVKELPVVGKHYQANALAALAIGYSFGLPFEPMIKVLREFTGLPHRCQFVREYQHVRWYNDSKGTNVGATQAAIEGLGSEIEGKLVLIAGGLGKGADFSPLVPLMEKYARHVVLIGKAAPDLATAIGNRIATSFAKTMEEAVQEAYLAAKPNDSVLLSPACASWDMYKNFEHRGQVFTGIVEKLGT